MHVIIRMTFENKKPHLFIQKIVTRPKIRAQVKKIPIPSEGSASYSSVRELHIKTALAYATAEIPEKKKSEVRVCDDRSRSAVTEELDLATRAK